MQSTSSPLTLASGFCFFLRDAAVGAWLRFHRHTQTHSASAEAAGKHFLGWLVSEELMWLPADCLERTWTTQTFSEVQKRLLYSSLGKSTLLLAKQEQSSCCLFRLWESSSSTDRWASAPLLFRLSPREKSVPTGELCAGGRGSEVVCGQRDVERKIGSSWHSNQERSRVHGSFLPFYLK